MTFRIDSIDTATGTYHKATSSVRIRLNAEDARNMAVRLRNHFYAMTFLVVAEGM